MKWRVYEVYQESTGSNYGYRDWISVNVSILIIPAYIWAYSGNCIYNGAIGDMKLLSVDYIDDNNEACCIDQYIVQDDFEVGQELMELAFKYQLPDNYTITVNKI